MKPNYKDLQAARDLLEASPNNLDLIKEIKKKRFRLSDLSVNPRNAVHWEAKNLFLNKKPEGTWQLLDLSESVWILMVQKLREFNFKLNLISDLKNDFILQPINNPLRNNKEDLKEVIRALNKQNVEHIINSKAFEDFIDLIEVNILETILMDILHLRNAYSILFNLNGQYVLVKDNFLNHPLQDYISDFISRSYFSISINEIVAELLGKIDLTLALGNYRMISQEEMEVLRILRTEHIKSVEISLNPKTNDIELINFTSAIQINAHQRLNELIMRNGYQEIIIKTENGQVKYCQNKIKIKPDTEKKRIN